MTNEFAALLAIGIGLCMTAAAARAGPHIADLEALVDRLNPDAVVNRQAVDAAFDTTLTDEGGRYFITSRASHVVLNDIPFREVELRAARPGAAVTAGPILILRVDLEAGACIPADDVLGAYPDLEWSHPPSPHAMDPDETRERRQGAARLFFAFPASGPDCLRVITYRFDEPL